MDARRLAAGEVGRLTDFFVRVWDSSGLDGMRNLWDGSTGFDPGQARITCQPSEGKDHEERFDAQHQVANLRKHPRPRQKRETSSSLSRSSRDGSHGIGCSRFFLMVGPLLDRCVVNAGRTTGLRQSFDDGYWTHRWCSDPE